MADIALQRLNMVESQVRPSDVTDRRIIRAMQQVAREAFLPPALQPIAYSDEALVLPTTDGGRGRGVLAPRVFAKLVQLADIDSDEVVLDIGCGLGYSAAVLSRVAQTVVALEQDKAMADEATRILTSQGADSVVVVSGKLVDGYAAEAPYDAIVIEGAVEQIPLQLLDQLKDGGRLVAIKMSGGVGRAVLLRRFGQQFDTTEAFDASAPMLSGFEAPKAFVF